MSALVYGWFSLAVATGSPLRGLTFMYTSFLTSTLEIVVCSFVCHSSTP